jgi:hypothetical protein
MARSDELVQALREAQGRRVAEPSIAGITGGIRGRTWDAFASAHAPDIQGDAIAFVTLADGTVVVDEDQPDGALGPLADAIEELAQPPYRAAAVRTDGEVWTVVAEKVRIVDLPEVDGDIVDLSLVAGARELRIDDEPSDQELPGLDALAAEHGDAVLHAERVDGDSFATDVFAL